MQKERKKSYELGRSFFNMLVQAKNKIEECDNLINNIRWDCWRDFRFGDSCRTINKIIFLMERKKKWLSFYKDALNILSKLPAKYRIFVKSYIIFLTKSLKNPKLSIYKDFQKFVDLYPRKINRYIDFIRKRVETELIFCYEKDLYFIQEVKNENLYKKLNKMNREQ